MITSAATEAQSAATTNNASQLGHWLEEYGEIAAILPVLTGLLVTTRLQLRGSNALVVNIAIAAITRQVIMQFKKQAGHAPLQSSGATPSANGGASHGGMSNGDMPATADEDYTIVHSVPGRIRLRIPRLQGDASYAKRVEKLLLTEDIVSNIRINRTACSLIIHYDGTNLTELDLGMRLLRVLEQAEQSDMES